MSVTDTNIISSRCDVTNRAAVMALAEKVSVQVGDVNILINNAGIMPCKPVLRHSEKEIKTMMDINVNGILWVSGILCS